MDAISVNRHKNLSVHYFENAMYFIDLGEIEKSSEFLWDSIAQALKALAATKGFRLSKHDDLKKYASDLSRELKDEGIWYSFVEAQSQHSNFYESGLTVEDVTMAAERIKLSLKKIWGLIK